MVLTRSLEPPQLFPLSPLHPFYLHALPLPFLLSISVATPQPPDRSPFSPSLPQMLPEPPEGLLALRLRHSNPPPHQGKSRASLTCPLSPWSQWDRKHDMAWSCLPLEQGPLPLFTPPFPPHTHLHSSRAVKPVLCSFLLPSFAYAVPSTWNIVSTLLHPTSSSYFKSQLPSFIRLFINLTYLLTFKVCNALYHTWCGDPGGTKWPWSLFSQSTAWPRVQSYMSALCFHSALFLHGGTYGLLLLWAVLLLACTFYRGRGQSTQHSSRHIVGPHVLHRQRRLRPSPCPEWVNAKLL